MTSARANVVDDSSSKGTYYLRTESGNLTLSTTFTPNASPLQSGQSVMLEALNGTVIVAGGSIQTFGSGNIRALYEAKERELSAVTEEAAA